MYLNLKYISKLTNGVMRCFRDERK